MLRIAVCDDEKHFRKDMKNYISKYMNNLEIEYRIDEFASGEEFVALGIEMLRYKVVFLDISMDGMDGIEVAGRIRKMSREILIVFVTAFVNYTMEGYKFDAVRYLLKGIGNFEASVNECMDAIAEKLNYRVEEREFEFRDGVRRIQLNRILYVESRLHKLEFHVMEKTMTSYFMYETLNNMEKELEDSNFVRIHQSYLVNLKHLKGIIKYKATLSNGKELAIPRARFQKVRDAFITYQGEI